MVATVIVCSKNMNYFVLYFAIVAHRILYIQAQNNPTNIPTTLVTSNAPSSSNSVPTSIGIIIGCAMAGCSFLTCMLYYFEKTFCPNEGQITQASSSIVVNAEDVYSAASIVEVRLQDNCPEVTETNITTPVAFAVSTSVNCSKP